MAEDDRDHEPDEIDKLIASDPLAHVAQPEDGTTMIWLATGDQMTLARDLAATKQKSD